MWHRRRNQSQPCMRFTSPSRARPPAVVQSSAHVRPQVPLLAVHGTSDKCTSMPAVKRLVEASCSADKTFRSLEGGYHEMLFDPEKEEVIRMVSEWVLERASKAKARL